MDVPKPIDLVIEARWVLPMVPAGVVLEEHSVMVDGGLIVGLMPHAQAAALYAPRVRFVLDQHIVLPGLVNAHTHAAMSLMRGLADDLPLMRWLQEHIWPAEAKHVSPEFVYDGTLLAAAEMLSGGITCANDMYFFPEASARAFLDAGMRASLGMIAIDVPTQYASDPDDYLTKGLAARDLFRDEPLLSFCMAPHAPYTVGDASFRRIVTIAEELDIPIHLHLHETLNEVDASVAQFGMRPLQRIADLGALGPRLIAVHAVHMNDLELDQLARAGASVALCPSSNLKLGSGVAPIAAMERRGINIALGTDGAASNNRLDLLQEMRTAALLAKGCSYDAEAMPAHAALHAATLGGAHALGLDRLIGSIEAGKAADLCAVSLAGTKLAPRYDIASHLVYACGREDVTHVWVAGEIRVNAGELSAIDVKGLEARVFLWQNKLLG